MPSLNPLPPAGAPVPIGGADAALEIGLLLIDGFSLMSFASVTEPLRVANLLSGKSLYRVRHLCGTGDRATSSGVVAVPADARLDDAAHPAEPDFDIVLVIAGGDPFAFENREVFRWLQHLARRGVTLGGVSGGPVLLARAGLMRGHRLTLHWEHAAALAARTPDLLIERSLYVIDGRRLSCAGGTAPLDLMHALIARAHGDALARCVSDWLLYTEVRPAGGAQRAGLVERYGVHQGPLLAAIGAMETHLADPLSLADLARIAEVGARQLTRLFAERLDSSPMAFYRGLRMERARALLQGSGLGVSEIARATGHSSAARFSAAYRAHYGCAPTRERAPLPSIAAEGDGDD